MMMIQCMKKLLAGGLPFGVLISSKFIQFDVSHDLALNSYKIQFIFSLLCQCILDAR